MSVCGPFLTMGLLTELFPDKHPITVYRWNGAKGGKNRLPDPDLTVGNVSLWSVDTIRAWAEARKLVLDSDVLDRICQSQQI